MSLFNDKVLIISEIGINHDGSLQKAKEMIHASAECGVDVCKFQYLNAAGMYPDRAGNYINDSGAYPIYDIVKQHEMPNEWIPELIQTCSDSGVRFLITVCEDKGLDYMLNFELDFLKIASSEISFLNLFRRIGNAGVPLIFSSAASSLGDIEEALAAYGDPSNACIMHCVGKYPAKPEMSNLNVLRTLQLSFPESVIGFSDHTEEPGSVPSHAVALGARIIEKHFTLDKNSPGPDHFFALNPSGMLEMVRAVRKVEESLSKNESGQLDSNLLGTSTKIPLTEESYLRRFCFRSIFAGKDIQEGEAFTLENLAILRAGELQPGLHPRYLDELVGLKSPKTIGKGTPINFQTLLKD